MLRDIIAGSSENCSKAQLTARLLLNRGVSIGHTLRINGIPKSDAFSINLSLLGYGTLEKCGQVREYDVVLSSKSPDTGNLRTIADQSDDICPCFLWFAKRKPAQMEMRSSRHFYDLLESQGSIISISDCLLEYLQPCGVNGVFIARLPSQNEVINPNILLDSWNPNWTEEYARQDYVKQDPIARHLLQTRNPYVWSDVCANKKLTPIERRIMDGAKDAGLIDGLTVPIHGPYKGVTCISFSTRGRRIEKFDQEDMRFVGILALSRIEVVLSTTELCIQAPLPRKGLSSQEIKCLRLAWRGFNSKQIAKQTDLTHRTVDQYLGRAMDKLNARNRTDAARLAMEYGFMEKG